MARRKRRAKEKTARSLLFVSSGVMSFSGGGCLKPPKMRMKKPHTNHPVQNSPVASNP